ncbi:DNA-binding response regulator [Desulfomarina profundi]|uniref:DNA-binding response regulator n=1 Tax=Desulfomarina profundi TaxID=2772557 RepID=A0A8D5FGW7_9BACT|nr:response regulator transcription factor [Desulfomarina profundi]BCL61407.1 DNA-binding response regulator [Desulfomarina profundi]
MADNITRLMVVDDHIMLLHGLCLFLNEEPDIEVIVQVSNARDALQQAERVKPDIILLDITLQKTSGLDLIEELLDLTPKTQIIILTMHDNAQYMQKALKKGARGFVLKKGLGEDLLYAIRSVMRGEIYVHPSLVKTYIPDASVKHIPQAAEEIIRWGELSAREQEVLILVARGYTSKEIAEKCLLSEKTIATYRSRGMVKLDIDRRSELVRLVMRLGKMG